MKVTCLDIELAIMRQYDFRQSLIVPNITSMMAVLPFETDMLVLRPTGYAIGFEIKTSKQDLKAEFKKPQHVNINQFYNGRPGRERYFGKFKQFYFAVPESLKEEALNMIPEFCGLWCLKMLDDDGLERHHFYKAKEAPTLYERKWSEKERYDIARLAAMRIYSLKYRLRQQLKINKP